MLHAGSDSSAQEKEPAPSLTGALPSSQSAGVEACARDAAFLFALALCLPLLEWWPLTLECEWSLLLRAGLEARPARAHALEPCSR